MRIRVQDRGQVSIAAITLLLIIAAMVIPLPGAAAPQTREIRIDARAFAYSPSSIEIHRGDTVNLTLEAEVISFVRSFLFDYSILKK